MGVSFSFTKEHAILLTMRLIAENDDPSIYYAVAPTMYAHANLNLSPYMFHIVKYSSGISPRIMRYDDTTDTLDTSYVQYYAPDIIIWE